MLDAKDVARKIVSGCGHTATVVVPCTGCIESQMKAWEAGIREDAKREFRDEWRQIKVERDEAKEDFKGLSICYKSLSDRADDLKTEKDRLTLLLKEARQQVEDLKVQLHAEQAFKQAVKMAAPKKMATR